MSKAFISNHSSIGSNVKIGINCIVEDDTYIGDNTFIDSNTIIRRGTEIGPNGFIGSNCILGEYNVEYINNRKATKNKLLIGSESIIRSGSIIYTKANIGKEFITGHHVTVREGTSIGNNVSVGTLGDIQGDCEIGDYVRIHSNVHIGKLSKIDSFVWIYPYVVLTNDPTPPSATIEGVHIHSFAIVATAATILPGINVFSDSLVAAGATVTKDVEKYTVVGGSPAKVMGDIREIKNRFTGEQAYPWREHFDKYMPWCGVGFDSWVNMLSDEEKIKYIEL